MKVLVTGATSGLGRNAAQWLLEQGHSVIAVGRDKRAGIELQTDGATFIAQDLTQCSDETFQSLVKGCHAVWHCAAKSSPWGNAEDFFQANVVVTEKLATAAGREGVQRFVHISSPAVYFDFQHHHDLPETYRASGFSSHYAHSKYAAEQALQPPIARYPDTQYIILRPRGLFGPHDRVIIPRLLQNIRGKNNVLPLPGGGTALLDLTFVLNVVHAMLLATTQPHLPSGAIYNITNHQPQPLAKMVTAILNQQLGYGVTVKAVPYRLLSMVAGGMEQLAKITGKEPRLTRYSVGAVYYDMTLDPRRAIDELGYHPLYSLEEGIVRTADWLRTSQGGSPRG